jgi:hypothetical protein
MKAPIIAALLLVGCSGIGKHDSTSEPARLVSNWQVCDLHLADIGQAKTAPFFLQWQRVHTVKINPIIDEKYGLEPAITVQKEGQTTAGMTDDDLRTCLAIH